MCLFLFVTQIYRNRPNSGDYDFWESFICVFLFFTQIIWALLNQLLLTALEEKFEWIHLVELDNMMTHSHPGDSFVDDTMSGVTNDDVTMEPVEISETALTPE
jgi:hypothetical protein